MGRTSKERELITGGPAIILCEPQLGENIGMVARAMANFGISELRLVNPREGWPNEKAERASAKAVHVIEGVRVFDDLPSAIADLTYVLATTARDREGYKPVLGPVTAARELRSRDVSGQKSGILFGRERWGLNNEEVSLSDAIVTFPVNPAFASLNIAQAVLLMSYEWMKTGLAEETDTAFSGPSFPPAPKQQTIGLFEQLEEALDARGYFRPAEKKDVMSYNLRSLLMRAELTETEIRMLRGIVTSFDHYSRQWPKGSKAPEGRARKAEKAGGHD